jgi:hypothetical protein
MSPAVKYTFGRVGLFVLIALLLWPVPIDLLLKLLIAVLVSSVLQFVVLRKWRAEMIGHVDQAVARHKSEKAKLRSALAGDEEDES